MSLSGPDEAAAAAMAEELLDGAVRITRFPTGLTHFVFEAECTRSNKVVVRISRRENADVARDALYLSARLRPLGVPLPSVLHAGGTR